MKTLSGQISNVNVYYSKMTSHSGHVTTKVYRKTPISCTYTVVFAGEQQKMRDRFTVCARAFLHSD